MRAGDILISGLLVLTVNVSWRPQVRGRDSFMAEDQPSDSHLPRCLQQGIARLGICNAFGTYANYRAELVNDGGVRIECVNQFVELHTRRLLITTGVLLVLMTSDRKANI